MTWLTGNDNCSTSYLDLYTRLPSISPSFIENYLVYLPTAQEKKYEKEEEREEWKEDKKEDRKEVKEYYKEEGKRKERVKDRTKRARIERREV